MTFMRTKAVSTEPKVKGKGFLDPYTTVYYIYVGEKVHSLY